MGVLKETIMSREKPKNYSDVLRKDASDQVPSGYLHAHLDALESEAIYILREVAAEFERPVLMFSGGKDSICLVHLSLKAFRPGKFPFPLLHIDTGHNFPETIEFRDSLVESIGERLIVRTVEDGIKKGLVQEPEGKITSRNRAQIPVLLDAISEFRFDAAIGGARRDEEKARAKERVYSVRDEFGGWDPRNQRPELWNLYNGQIQEGEQVRAFPISNWTELDVWQYIRRENIEVPSLYFAHEREVFLRDGQLLSVSPFSQPNPGEEVSKRSVRFRTIGDIICTGAIESNASSLEPIIDEIAKSKITERGARSDDKVSEAAMEDRKKEGYF